MSKKLDKLSSLIPIYDLEQSAQSQIYEALALDFLIKLLFSMVFIIKDFLTIP